MSKKGYRQKPWLYIVTDPVKGWRNKIGRPTSFDLNLDLDRPSRFTVLLPPGSHTAPLTEARRRRRKLSFVLLVPALGTFRFDGAPQETITLSGAAARDEATTIIIDLMTFQFRQARRKQPQKAAA